MEPLTARIAETVEPLALTVEDARRSLGIGRTKLYELIDLGELDIFKIGGATRVTYSSLKEFVARRLRETAEESR